MSEEELRQLVRETVARQLGQLGVPGPDPVAPSLPSTAPGPAWRRHFSHVRFSLPAGRDTDEGACLVEPAVRCSHCGYCQSWGH